MMSITDKLHMHENCELRDLGVTDATTSRYLGAKYNDPSVIIHSDVVNFFSQRDKIFCNRAMSNLLLLRICKSSIRIRRELLSPKPLSVSLENGIEIAV